MFLNSIESQVKVPNLPSNQAGMHSADSSGSNPGDGLANVDNSNCLLQVPNRDDSISPPSDPQATVEKIRNEHP